MADRVKYFLLGVLFLVVAGVIAYDRWNSTGVPEEVALGDAADSGADLELVTPLTGPRESGPPLTVENKESGDRGDRPDPEQETRTVRNLPELPPADDTRRGTDVRNVTPTPEPTPPAPEPAPTPKTHVIRKGETLEKIALRYYGTREGIKWIVEANRLADANRIFIDQKLIIPAKKEITPRTPRKEPAESTARSERPPAGQIPSRYVVKQGDGDLYAICRRFYGSQGQGARVAAVMELNHLWSADVKPGTVLMLPSR